LSADERLPLDTLRQYIRAGSETEASAPGHRTLAEPLLAGYLAAETYKQRCSVLLGLLNIVAGCTPVAYKIEVALGVVPGRDLWVFCSAQTRKRPPAKR